MFRTLFHILPAVILVGLVSLVGISMVSKLFKEVVKISHGVVKWKRR